MEDSSNNALQQEEITIHRARINPTTETCTGGIIQPLNPHFAGSEVDVYVDNEDPDVEWIPGPDLVAVVVANEDAIPLSREEIAAINVVPERITSSDDDRPASSFPLLDRRHYREDPSPTFDGIFPYPLAIGSIINEDEEAQVFNEWEASTTVTASIPRPLQTPTMIPRRMEPQDTDEFEATQGRRRRKRKAEKKERLTDETPPKQSRNDDDDDDDKGQRRLLLGGMSGRRHSGFRQQNL